jgi:hypothetical protein
LNVGGIQITTTWTTLIEKYPASLFAAHFNDEELRKLSEQKQMIYVDYDPDRF